MDIIRKGSDLREKNGGHRAFKRVKSLRSSQSDCLFRTVTSLRNISEKTWVHSYPMMPQATLCPRGDQTLARCHVCLFSWSAIHDVCVTCAKKCAAAVGANVLKLSEFDLTCVARMALMARGFSYFFSLN